MEGTRFVDIPERNEEKIRQIIFSVYESLKEKGYNPISQMVGDIMSGDPTDSTSDNNARALIGRLERDDILEELLKNYLNK